MYGLISIDCTNQLLIGSTGFYIHAILSRRAHVPVRVPICDPRGRVPFSPLLYPSTNIPETFYITN